MFDWDRDYESLVETPHVVGTAAVAALLPQSAPAPTLWQGRAAGTGPRARRWALAGALSLALAAALAGWPALVPGAEMLPEALPMGLIVYEPPHYDNFRHGIAGFSDTDLLNYLRHAERDLAAGSPVADFTRDALFLAEREVDRRGLQRPMVSLRDAFGPN